MKKSRFSETQIVSILKEADAGLAVIEICRKHEISSPTCYKWKAKYGGLGAFGLKRMYADKAMEADALKDVIEKKL